ncbi:hypothetical protein Athai_14310 [Actinocatenispora thailandica]|uniref:Uncharacterized protein n=1 Tax=Actinocatenispora thailandica TaxID=227318 RepID=A0A7R7DLQ3_9ACTN|nr:hypothetical protein Athai_14310 [Actinocatenispora thailandica]
MPAANHPSLLRTSPRFGYYWLARTISMAGTAASGTILPLLVYDPTQAATTNASGAMPPEHGDPAGPAEFSARVSRRTGGRCGSVPHRRR